MNIEKYEESLLELRQLVSEIEEDEECENLDEGTMAVYQLYDALISGRQLASESVSAPIRSKRLIKIKRIIPDKIAESNSGLRIVLGGVYINAEVYLLPMDQLTQATKKDPIMDAVDDPEKYGLPSCDLVMYSTRRRVNNQLAVALPKHTWLSDYLTTASHYEYPVLD